MIRNVVITLFLAGLTLPTYSQPGSFGVGASFSSGWISGQLQESTAWGIRGGLFGNYRFSKHFGVESGLYSFRKQAGRGSGFFSENKSQVSNSFLELPILLRIYVVQNEKSPWQVHIDMGYSLMRRVSNHESIFGDDIYSHNLILGLGVQRMVTGPFFLGLNFKTTNLDITDSFMAGRHLWDIGLRAGMKLGR